MLRLFAVCLALTLGAASVPFAAQAQTQGQDPFLGGFDDPVLDQRYRDLLETLRCLQCQNQSIADSPSNVAGDQRRLIRDMIAEGRSDDEIRTYLAERYGDFILYRPPLNRKTWLLWGAPALLLLGGGFIFARTVRARMQQPLDEELES